MARRNEKHAIFLEIDGVLTRTPQLTVEGRVPWLDDVLEPLAAIDPRDFLLIVASNREDIGLGNLKEREFKRFIERFERDAEAAGVRFAKIYTSPWHPKGKTKWRKESVFRKPAPGMYKIAQQEFDLNLSRCWAIGHRTVDVLAGQRGGVGTVLLHTGAAGQDGEYQVEANHEAPTLRHALRYVSQFEAALRC
jgi:HAD superfamily hydrolase (TIGR01662 family)